MAILRGLTLEVAIFPVPSDTKLLLTKNDFEKLRISHVIPLTSLFFPEISRARNSSKVTKNHSQGIILVIISCQRVLHAQKIANRPARIEDG